MTTRTTAWFPPNIKPFHVGPYRTEHGFQWWNGKQWGYFDTTPSRAARWKRYRSSYQDVRWQGLDCDPKAKRRKGRRV